MRFLLFYTPKPWILVIRNWPIDPIREPWAIVFIFFSLCLDIWLIWLGLFIDIWLI